ncbi:MAG: tRNA (adenosine(37)-N6)-threonylcarbamoyltransferase complex ATPase subunit type 1 TsaE [Gammaproteobacteria bacterium]|nr:MAG: tRNA (adenosine(37)-N6)-threonylcarbamoyltransferase complex ATPase subunit type 1 TsaE [Gammaproteobacteria bacterium]
MTYKLHIKNESMTELLAQKFAQHFSEALVFHLDGDLGAGKTAFVRAFLRAMGHEGAVRSPTYTLMENYDLKGFEFYHFDLYRLEDPEELEFIGIRDLDIAEHTFFIEWPEKGHGAIYDPDIQFFISVNGAGRIFNVTPNTKKGATLLEKIDFSLFTE